MNFSQNGSSLLVSIIVPAFNIEKYIEQSLQSILDQTYKSYEIILIDDGSTDATIENATKCLIRAENYKLIKQDNAGPGAARNAGLKQASGEYVIFLDGDDWLTPEALAHLVQAAGDTLPDIIFSNRRKFWESSKKYTTPKFVIQRSRGHISKFPEVMSTIAIHGKLFSREFLQRNEIEFPEKMSCEDFVFTYAVYSKARFVELLPEITYIYRKRAASNNLSLTQARLTDFNLESRFRQIELTLKIADESELRSIFPEYNFNRVEFQSRLMRHVNSITDEKNQDVQKNAFDQIRRFLLRHQKMAIENVSSNVRKIYVSILDKDYKRALLLIEENQ